MASNLALEPGHHEHSHSGERPEARPYFHFDLVLQKSGMFHHPMIKDKIIRQASEEEIKDYCAEEGYPSHREHLPDDVGPWPSRNELFPEDCWWGRLEKSGQGFSKAGKPCGTLC